MKKLLALLTLGVIVTLNASLVEAVTGPNISDDEYKNKNRGIIVNQDVDGDGIIDSKDDCLETIPCQKEGCQKEEVENPVVIGDLDKDGVLDNIDVCPNTPNGFEVDEKGCSKLVNLQVQFDTAKFDIKTDFTEKLDKFVDFMNNHMNYTAEIQGHTDSRASTEYNQELSANRANSVKAYLISKGIDENRLIAVGYGELEPIDSNETQTGRANNRRVIAVLKKQ